MNKWSVIGIDISAHEVRAALLTKKGKRFYLYSLDEVLSSEVLIFDNYTFNYQEIIIKLQELKSILPKFILNVAISIPNDVVTTRIISIDSHLQGQEIPLAIEQYFTTESAIPLQDLSIDFVKLADESVKNLSVNQYYASVTSRALIIEMYNALVHVGFIPVLIESEQQSILRATNLAHLIIRSELQQSKGYEKAIGLAMGGVEWVTR